MCILCVVQKWSRRVATMLPWLVIPLIGLWALSQLLPPGFRFEITSPRLACVFVLLVTLFWYEILMPQLSAWRVRRSARLRERERSEAIELQKLRKTATRRCRNCLTPYRDQKPGGGRFMCSYCGHVSKRPVLDIPESAGMGIANSGIVGDLVGRGGKIWSGKVWTENGWIGGQDWLENGNWVAGTLTGKSSYWGKNGGFLGIDDCCVADKSYSGGVVFACNLLASFFLSIRWIFRKIFRVDSVREDASLDAEHKGMLHKNGENGVDFHESKGEKARRKAEEKKQARLERELLEEEERKQREEVARLVEERRRMRDEKMQAENEHGKGLALDREKDNKREAERKRQERRKEKDKGSNISNSDGEELERRAGKESERKHEFDKRTDIDRRESKTGTESIKAQSSDTGHSIKVTTTNNFSRGSAGTRYMDRVKGSFLSSKAFTRASFFGNDAHTSATVVSKADRSNCSIDNVQISANRREVHLTEHKAGKSNFNGDNKVNDISSQRPVNFESQPETPPKKSWQQLFTRSPAVSPPPTVNTISRPNQKPQTDIRSPQLPGQASVTHPLENPFHFGLSLPFTFSPFPNGSISSTSVSSAAESIHPLVGERPHEFVPEKPELSEDPCYVSDPVSLLGPVSESLDSFPLELGSGFVTDTKLERPQSLQNTSSSTKFNRSSPIESPMTRLRVAEDMHTTSNRFQCTPRTHNLHSSPIDAPSNAHEQGTWQMWGTPTLGQDRLSLVGGPASWLLPLGQSQTNQEDVMHPSSHKAMLSQFAKDNEVLPGTHSSQKVPLGNCQNGGTFSPLGPGSNDNNPWLQQIVFQPLSTDREKYFPPVNPRDDLSQNEMTYGSTRRAATGHPFEPSPANCSSKRDWPVHGSEEGIGNSNPARPHVGGLFSTPDVQSLWSFN